MNLPLDSDRLPSPQESVFQVPTFESMPATNVVPIVESSGKKRKLSSKSATNSEISGGPFFIPVISETGDPLYHLQVVPAEEYHDNSSPVKKVIDEKDLKSLRIQIAMLSDIDGDKPIHVAVVQENVKLVRKLCSLMLKAGISLDLTNYHHHTPLHLAVMVSNKELVVLLLKCGACIGLRDRRGNSVLHLAVKSNAKKDILAIILARSEAKSIINMLDYEGYSALHYAVIKRNGTLIKCFHRFKADMNVPDGKSGRSPLIHAILHQNADMVRLLFECGAVSDTVDYSGRSAFELALLASNKLITKLVEKNLSSADAVQRKSETKDGKDTEDQTSDRSSKTRCSERSGIRSKRVCRSNTYPQYEAT